MAINNKLTKDINIIRSHLNKIIFVIIYIIITSMAIVFIVYEKNRLDSLSIKTVNAKSEYNKIVAETTKYNQLKSREKQILTQLKAIDRKKMFLVNFNSDKFIEYVINEFKAAFNIDIKYKINNSVCDNYTQYNNNFTQCKEISTDFISILEDKIYQNFEMYLKDAMPGFIVPIKINNEKKYTNHDVVFDINTKYVWIYFLYNS